MASGGIPSHHAPATVFIVPLLPLLGASVLCAFWPGMVRLGWVNPLGQLLLSALVLCIPAFQNAMAAAAPRR